LPISKCAIRLSNDLRCAVGKPAVLFRASDAAWSRTFESQGRKNNQSTSPDERPMWIDVTDLERDW